MFDFKSLGMNIDEGKFFELRNCLKISSFILFVIVFIILNINTIYTNVKQFYKNS